MTNDVPKNDVPVTDAVASHQIKAAHTPGPWKIDRGHASGFARGISAATRNIVNFNGLASPTAEESQANANLIAAAPELLEALAEFVRIEDEDATGLLAECGSDVVLAIEKARAALSKARGHV